MIPREFRQYHSLQACLHVSDKTNDRKTPRRSGFSKKKREIRGVCRIAKVQSTEQSVVSYFFIYLDANL